MACRRLIRATALSSPSTLLTGRRILYVTQSRSFFGLGEIAGVIANPAETLRQLNESKDMLQKAKEDLELSREAKRIPKKHTFSKLPGFHGRKKEQALLRRILSNTPKLSVIFGATSVGKTALLREVLAGDDFYVIKFDLRISGFADLRTLYIALCEQFQNFFEDMHDEEMDKQKLVFKHSILALEEKEDSEGGYTVTVADIANLMESLQSALLAYWTYEPAEAADGEETNAPIDEQEARKKESRKVDATKDHDESSSESREEPGSEEEANDEKKKKFKKRPVVFLMDEAHKLPALVNDQLSLKVFLDTILVLTKQDRLCHVLLSTSDSFFHQFLRQMNVGHHAQIVTIGDCTKAETETFFVDELLQTIPKNLQTAIKFDDLYETFGGKLSHINDYVSSWVNSEGTLTPYTSAIFVQAYTLLQFHLTHEQFETFSPLSTATSGTSTKGDDAQFTAKELAYVMRKMVEPPYSMPYFTLCRDIGTEKVDSMIKTRILELRWTKSVSPEEGWIERVWSEDGIERPIVMPMTRIIRRAMEVILQEGNLPDEGEKDAATERKDRKEDRKQEVRKKDEKRKEHRDEDRWKEDKKDDRRKDDKRRD